MSSSQDTHVAGRETKSPPSGQYAKTDATILVNDSYSQTKAADAFTNGFSNDTKIQSVNQESSFTDVLEQYQEELDRGFNEYETNIAEGNSANLDWDDLETNYQREVGEVAMKEKEIMSQFDARFKQFMLWMQVSDEREGQRAIKRLKTQSAYVQNSEAELARKELHYSNVMEAFHNAMSLLSRPS